MLTNDDVEVIVKIVNTGNDILLDKIVEIINAQLLCKDGGKVVRKDPQVEKDIQAKEIAKRHFREVVRQ